MALDIVEEIIMLSTDRQIDKTGYPSIEKPWMKYYTGNARKSLNPDCGMYTFLRRCNTSHMNLTALNYFGTKISYKSLFEHIDQMAIALQKYGVKKGDFISLCGLNTPEFVYLLYAINKVGAISNWLGLTSPVSDLREQLAFTESELVFAIDLALDKIKEAAQNTRIKKIIPVPFGASMPPALRLLYGLKSHPSNSNTLVWKAFLHSVGNNTAESVKVAGNELAMIEYTGGSTGTPKGVMLSNYALNSHYISFCKTNDYGILSFKTAEKILSGVPIFLVFGMCACFHSPLCHSLQLILAPDPSPEAMTDRILKSKVNHIMCGRLQIDALVSKSDKRLTDLSFIHMIMYGGEETNKNWEMQVLARLNRHNLSAPLLNSYGMSETAAGVLIAPDNDTDGLIPCADVNVKIINPENALAEYKYGEEGELCISTPQMMSGYYKNAAETKEVFFEESGIRWLRTRDLAMITSDGIIHITGRIKRIYHKLSPEQVDVRVYPMRIEEVILEKSGVEKCAVVGVKDDQTAYRTIAYVILQNPEVDTQNIKKEIDTLCRTRLPESHVPDEYVIVNEFPLTRAGKTDYRELEKQAKKGRLYSG